MNSQDEIEAANDLAGQFLAQMMDYGEKYGPFAMGNCLTACVLYTAALLPANERKIVAVLIAKSIEALGDEIYEDPQDVKQAIVEKLRKAMMQ